MLDGVETADATKGPVDVAAEMSEPMSRDSRVRRFVLNVRPRSGGASLSLLFSAWRRVTFLAGRSTRSPTTRGRSSQSRDIEPELEVSWVAVVTLETFDELVVDFCGSVGLLKGLKGSGSGRNGFPPEGEVDGLVATVFPYIRFGVENLSSHPSEGDGEPMTTALVEAEPW